MNLRPVLHATNAMAGVIAAGSITFAGLSDNETHNIVALAGLYVTGMSIVLGLTSSGTWRPQKPPENIGGEGEIP